MGIILDANKKESGFNKDSTGNDDVEYVGVKHTLDDVFIHQKELDILREQYSKSIVQDFCDNYHISKEDREKNRAEYEKIYKLRNMRSNCPRLSEYVKEWRIIIEIIREIAKNNKLIDENEFIAKSFTGKIHINGVKFPKYVGKRKKLINWEYIINDYILEDNKDPDELDYLTFDPLDLDSDDLDEDTLLDDPLIKNIVMSYKEKSDEDILNIIESGDPESGVISSSNKYSDKKLRKLYPELFRGIRNVKKIEDKLNRVKGIYHEYVS